VRAENKNEKFACSLGVAVQPIKCLSPLALQIYKAPVFAATSTSQSKLLRLAVALPHVGEDIQEHDCASGVLFFFQSRIGRTKDIRLPVRDPMKKGEPALFYSANTKVESCREPKDCVNRVF
jgi:hypothetical protein